MPAKPVLKPLGKNGPLVPRIGFGLMGMSHSYGEIPSDEERFKLLDHALEQGNTFWDTSDLYGDNEELLSKWFKRTGKRDQIFLATKYGYVKGGKFGEVDSSYEYTKKACSENLKRLGVDVIDLYYAHSVNPETPIEETMRALKELQDEGKIRHIGLSLVSSATLRRAVKIAPVAAVQTGYTLNEREIEGPEGGNLLATCRELGVAVVVATPLGRGILTSEFGEGALADSGEGDVRGRMLPQFQAANRDHNMRLVAGFRALADKRGCSVAQLALAWLLAQGDDVFPIPGTRRAHRLDDNWAAQDVVFTPEEELEIRRFAESSKVAGGALPPSFEAFRFRDTKEMS
ncbi:putative aldo-keto reductase [Hypoxylon sp. FL1284]|nr:putative aldo-keto reductase [Hypoxylon sp. FL1284]